MDYVGHRAPYFNYDRTFLPQLPTNVKNRNMEECRQALRTSSELYGKFWIDDVAGESGIRPTAIGAPSPTRVTDRALAATSRYQPPRCSWPLPNFPYVCQSHSQCT